VAAAIKLTPLIYVPYFWFSGQRRTAVTATATVGTAAGWLLLPKDPPGSGFVEVWNVHRIGSLSSGETSLLAERYCGALPLRL
jgi:alpha-1,2-mannosyltransferase